MSSINKVILIGSFSKDPDIRITPYGQIIINLSLATSEKFKNKNGVIEERTEWHHVVLGGKLAEINKNYIQKGKFAYIEGRLQNCKWEDKDGQHHYTTEIVGERMHMLERKGDNNHLNENSVGAICDKDLMSQFVIDKAYLTETSMTKPSESKQQSLDSNECPWDLYPIEPRSQSASASASNIHSMTTLQKLTEMQKRSSWLNENDYDTLMNISKDIDKDKNILKTKSKIIDRIYVNFLNNQQPQIFRGGSPGSGRGGR